jgi:hypothetical protein
MEGKNDSITREWEYLANENAVTLKIFYEFAVTW